MGLNIPCIVLYRLDVAPADEIQELSRRWCSNPTFSDNNRCSRPIDVQLRTMTQSGLFGITPDARQAVCNLSPSWQPAVRPTSWQSSSSVGSDVVFPTNFDPPPQEFVGTLPTHRPNTKSTSSSRLLFPLLAPISTASQTPALPYVRLEPVASRSPAPTHPTSFVHTASVHASPDVASRPEVTSSDLPATDFRYSADVIAFGEVAVPPFGRRNSGISSDVDAGAMSDTNFADSVIDMSDTWWSKDVELPDHPHNDDDVHSCCGLDEPYSAAVYDISPVILDIDDQTTHLLHCRSNSDCRPLFVVGTSTSGDDYVANKCLERLSMSADDGGPSRKRYRGGTGPRRYGVKSAGTAPAASDDADSISGADPSTMPLSGGCSGDDEALQTPAETGVSWRRRRPRGIQHLLSAHRRRRRRDHITRRNFDVVDADRCLTAAAHHSADELECFLPSSTDEDATSYVTTSTQGRDGQMNRGSTTSCEI